MTAPTRGPEPYPTEYVVSHHGNPVWEAIWRVIKGWDIERERGAGRTTATGDDATRLYEAVRAALSHQAAPPREASEHPGKVAHEALACGCDDANGAWCAYRLSLAKHAPGTLGNVLARPTEPGEGDHAR